MSSLFLSQRRIVALAWITYAAYYLCRVNFATALPQMQPDLGLSKAQIGVITGSFLWMYAAGQLINGWLGDRLSPRWVITAGMIGSALLNLGFVSTGLYPLLIGLWAINGYMQATGWPPMLRILANWLSPTQRTSVSGIFGSCFMIGNALTWLFTGWLISNYGWRSAFWVPALLLLAFAALWGLFASDSPEEIVTSPHKSRVTDHGSSAIRATFTASIRIWPLLAATFANGCAQVALTIWLPTYFVEESKLAIGTAASFSALMPFTGAIGSLIAAWVVARMGKGREALALALMFALVALLFLLFPFLPSLLWLTVATLVLISMAASGATGILLATMPLALSGKDDAATMGGLVNFFFNLGAGVSSGLIGVLLDSSGWMAVFLAVSTATAIAILFLGIMQRKMTKF